jgi:pimeloyl-ACP methyl ester carboxylesterase
MTSLSGGDVATGTRFANVRLATGPQLHYAEQGDVGGEPIVFLHGWPDSWFTFSRVLPLLPTRVRALVLDQRGFGDSNRPASGYEVDDFAADVAAFLDALAVDRATIVGHSFGSFVARAVAIAYPQRVARLVLIGTGATAANPVTREVQASIRDLSDPVPVAFARDFQASTAYASLPEEFFERVVEESCKLPARLWREVFDHLLTYVDVERWPRIAAPTLLLWGEHDALFPRSDQDRVVASIKGARLRVYEGIGHCPNWECPDLVAADLAAFLQEA